MTALLLLVALFAALLTSIVAAGRARSSIRRGADPAAARERAVRLTVVASGIGAAAASGVLVASVGGPVSAVIERPGGTALTGFAADRIGAIVLALTTGVGLVVQSFARRALRADPRALRFAVLAAALTATTSAVAVAATATVAVAAWVAATVVLVALIRHRDDSTIASDAAALTRRILIVGDAVLVAGMAVVLVAYGDIDLRDVASTGEVVGDGRSVAGVGVASIFAVALVVAGVCRSALIPAHRWLPATLAAPTPLSALLHAGVINGAGVLFLQFAPIFGFSTVATHIAFALGVATAVLATGVMLVRADVKGQLAWSTIGQMGFMVVQCAVGAFGAALFHLVGHGMYKAGLFLGAGGAITAHRRERERPHDPVRPPTLAGRTVAAVVPALAIALAFALIRPDFPTTESMLVAAFAWATAFRMLMSTLRRTDGASATTVSTVVVAVAAFGYVAAVSAFDAFVAGDFAKDASGVVGPVTLGAVLAVVAIAWVTCAAARGPVADRIRLRSAAWLVAFGSPIHRSAAVGSPAAAPAVRSLGESALVGGPVLVAEARRAASVIAPAWPLTTFVAVNPLGGLQHRSFDDATAAMRSLTGVRTHLPESEYRALFGAGDIGRDDLRAAAAEEVAELAFVDDIEIDGTSWSAVDVVVADLLHGPTEAAPTTPSADGIGRLAPEVADAVDQITTSWLALHVDEGVAAWSLPDRDRGFYAAWRAVATIDPRVAALVGNVGHAWLRSLPADATGALATALGSLDVEDDDRVGELRRHLVRLPGYSGYARWRDEWAPADHPAPPLQLIDILAVRCSLEAAAAMVRPAVAQPDASVDVDTTLVDLSEERARDVAAAIGAPDARAEVGAILSLLSDDRRRGIWLAAHERAVRASLLAKIDARPVAPPSPRPDLQAVFCIDVRSEVIRRHLEEVSRCETLGFAGFFGVPIRWTAVGSTWAEPRCPVLVTPVHDVAERSGSDAGPEVERLVARRRVTQRSVEVYHDTKGSATGPFALAEIGGFLAGPAAAVRTLAPLGSNDPHPVAPTEVGIDAMTLDERALFAEAILRTMGLAGRIGRLVLLCGHGAETTNNPHASALDCGACGGAHGGPSARVAARILNDPLVRERLTGVGIEVPADARFVAGEHDTVSDTVTIFDAPVDGEHAALLGELTAALEEAGARVAAERAIRLPGDPATVRRRGNDWAEVRPEWGLAGNAAFVIAPREMTRDVDLGGRAFLHSYDAEADVEGLALETIMTAPLVVAQWISAQYYFSTVDQDRFGAGDKILHNPVGGIGVVTGQGGDLRVGLPEQSVAIGGRNAHDPVRLMAVVQAPLERVERIIQRNQVLRELVGGRWITVVGRSSSTDEWSVRTPAGTWVSWTPSDHFRTPTGPATSRDERLASTGDAMVDERVGV